MKLEEAVLLRWAGRGALNAAMPVAKVWTGEARGATPPYAVWERTESRPAARTNLLDRFDDVTLVVHLWFDEYAAGLNAVAEVVRAFDRTRLELGGADGVAAFRRLDDLASREDGLWRFAVRFAVRTFAPADPAA